MNESLRAKIRTIRELLEADPNGILTGSLEPGNLSAADASSVPEVYRQFLTECDGAQFGDVALYSLQQVADAENHPRGGPSQAELHRLPGGSSKWFCFGGLNYDLLAMDRENERVFVFARVSDAPPEEVASDLGPMNDFLDAIFSSRYADVCDVEEDCWLALLRSVGLDN